MSDTNTKTLLNRISSKVPDALPSYARAHMSRYRNGKRAYNPTRMMLNVMGINLIPLTVLLFFIALMGDYKERLINVQLELLYTQTQLYAHILDQDGLETRDIHALFPNFSMDDQIMVIAQDGTLPIQSPVISSLSENEEQSFFTKTVGNFIDSMMFLTNVNYRSPALPSLNMQDMREFPGVKAGFRGHKNISAWTLKNETLVFTSIMPLSNDHVVLFVHHAKSLAEDLSRFQQDIFRIFISIMTLSIAFSLYLVGTITNPLRKLAKAAETINNDTNKLRHNIPDMSDRGDEIGELSIALSSMVETLWARMGTIEAFAADVSHELKNPITSIKSAIETLPKIKNKQDKEQLLKILAFDVDRLDRLITDISKSTRLDVELSQGATDVIYLDEFLRDILKIYETHPLCQDMDISINLINNAQHGLCIIGNKDKLTQVIVNIVDNAISFSAKHETISVFVDNDANMVTISIRDMGPGIPDKKLDKIFERFYSNRPKKEGQEHHSGLGLSIVRQIVRAHDGRIVAENIKDESGDVLGASFQITLPSYEKG